MACLLKFYAVSLTIAVIAVAVAFLLNPPSWFYASREEVDMYKHNLSQAVSLPADLYMYDYEKHSVYGSTVDMEPFTAATSFPDVLFYFSTHVGSSTTELFVNFHMISNRYFPLRANVILQLVDKSGRNEHHIKEFENLLFWKTKRGGLETGDVKFLEEVHWRFVKRNSIHFRVLSIELDSNNSPPFNFAMCDYQYLKDHNGEWQSNFFQTSSLGFKFFISVQVNSCTVTKKHGKQCQFVLKAFRVHPFVFSKISIDIYHREWEGSLAVRFHKVGGGMEVKELTELARGDVCYEFDQCEGVEFESIVWTDHEELEQNFISYDCLFFEVDFLSE